MVAGILLVSAGCRVALVAWFKSSGLCWHCLVSLSIGGAAGCYCNGMFADLVLLYTISL